MFRFNRIVLSAIVAIFQLKIFAQGAPSSSLSLQSNQTIQNEEIVSTVIDMNSSNTETSALFNQFNISREDVERKLSQINDSNAEDESRR